MKIDHGMLYFECLENEIFLQQNYPEGKCVQACTSTKEHAGSWALTGSKHICACWHNGTRHRRNETSALWVMVYTRTGECAAFQNVVQLYLSICRHWPGRLRQMGTGIQRQLDGQLYPSSGPQANRVLLVDHPHYSMRSPGILYIDARTYNSKRVAFFNMVPSRYAEPTTPQLVGPVSIEF